MNKEDFNFVLVNRGKAFSQCEKGEKLNYWIPKCGSKIMFIRNNYSLQEGLVGEAPANLTFDLIEHINRKNCVDFFIYDGKVGIVHKPYRYTQ